MSITLILQQEAIECGLACIAMIHNSYGSNASLDSLRRKFDLSLRGTSIAELVRIADALDLEAIVYLLKPNQLSTLNGPAILYWNTNHYVVLEKVNKKKGYLIHDPGAGSYWANEETIKKHYSNYVLILKPKNSYKPFTDKGLTPFKELIRKVPKSHSYFWVTVFATSLLQLLVLLFPSYLQKLIDPFLGKTGITDTIYLYIFALMILKINEALLYFLRGIIIGKWQQAFTSYLGSKILYHLLSLPLNFFDKHSRGFIYSKLSSIERTREILSRGLAEGTVDSFSSIFILFIIYIFNLKIGFIVSSLTIIYLMLNYYIANKARFHNDIQIKERSKESAFLIECLQGIIPIKIFSREKQRLDKWLDLHQNHLRSAKKIHFLQSILDALRILIFGLQVTIVIVFSLNLISKNHLTLGSLYALLFYINILSKNVSSITTKWFDVKMLSTHGEQLGNILSYQKESGNRQFAVRIDRIDSIELRNISFRYHRNEAWILKNISFSIKAKECVILFGPSGYGKSTLLKILMGLLEPSDGEIYVNDQLLKKENLLSYRKNISAIMQDDELLSGTIYENISFFSKEVDKKKAEYCARLAGISDEIELMPMKYHSYIGNMGIAISGGQKQRLLLARALYFEPKIIFLDEAFSNLDIQREKMISSNLKQLGITLFIITHRQELLSIADRIIDIESLSLCTSQATANLGFQTPPNEPT